MKKFLKYILIFLLPVLIAGIAAEYLVRKIPNEYTFKKNYLDTHADSIQAIILGSSHAYFGINPAYLSVPAFNASQPSQSLDYDYEIIRKYQDKLTNLKYIIIPISYNSFYSRLNTHIESWRVKNYMIYCDIHTSHKVKDNSEILGGKFEFNLDKLVHYYILKDHKINCSALGWGMDYNSSHNHDLEKTGIAAATRQHVAPEDRENFEGNRKMLESIIAIAKQKGATVVLYTSPGYKTYTSSLHKDQLALTEKTAGELAASNNNVRYFNMLTDSSFAKADFYDGDHFNEIGAEKFSRKMDSLLTTLKKQ